MDTAYGTVCKSSTATQRWACLAEQRMARYASQVHVLQRKDGRALPSSVWHGMQVRYMYCNAKMACLAEQHFVEGPAKQSYIIWGLNFFITESGFETCFGRDTQHLWCWGSDKICKNTSRTQMLLAAWIRLIVCFMACKQHLDSVFHGVPDKEGVQQPAVEDRQPDHPPCKHSAYAVPQRGLNFFM